MGLAVDLRIKIPNARMVVIQSYNAIIRYMEKTSQTHRKDIVLTDI